MARNTKLVCASLLLIALLAGCGSSHETSIKVSTPPASPSQAVSVRLTDFAISPSPITVQAGNVTFNAVNAGQSVHNFEVKQTDNSKRLGGTKSLDPWQSAGATLDLQKGTYVGYCSEPGHESLGMKVSIVVN